MKNLFWVLFLFFLSCDIFIKESFNPSQISIHTKENQNIDRKKTILLTTLDWQPYIGQDLKDYGYVYQLVKQIFEYKGYSVVIKFYPWARTMKLAISGEVDGYFPEYFNEDLKKDFYFSDPYPGGPAGFYGRKDISYQFKTEYNMKNFEKLIPYKIGVVRGYTNTKYFDMASYLKKEETIDDLSNLKKLYFRRVELIFIDPNVARYLIQSYLLNSYPDVFDKTYFLEPELEYKYLYVCISKNVPFAQQKIEDFNSGLRDFYNKGIVQKIIKENHFNHKGIWNP